MNRTDLLYRLAGITGCKVSDLTSRGNYLREGGIIPGGRGHLAKKLTVWEVANIIVASTACERPKQVVETVRSYQMLLPSRGQTFLKRPAESFMDTLAYILSSQEAVERVMNITVCQSFPEATILHSKFMKSIQVRVGYVSEMAEQERQLVRKEIVIDGAFFRQVFEWTGPKI